MEPLRMQVYLAVNIPLKKRCISMNIELRKIKVLKSADS
jgi:hypothetical protein